MVVIAFLNGALRALTFGRRLTELRAHQLSTLIGIILLGAYIWAVTVVRPISSPRQALAVGLAWMSLTVAFEFVVMHYIAGHSWRRLLDDYNVLQGRVWPVFLLWIAAAPYVFFKIRRTY